MTEWYDRSELRDAFIQKCRAKLSFLAVYGFELTSINDGWYGVEITYKNQTTGIQVSFEAYENNVFLYLIRLINGEIPDYLDAPSRWFYLDNLLALRSPTTTLPRKTFGEQLTPDDLDRALTVYSVALREHAKDVLSGDFAVFAELRRFVDRPRSPGGPEDARMIASQEELAAQQKRLLPQIVEYYDTYLDEVRRQLQKPHYSDLPPFFGGFKRVLSVGGSDGVVVAHFPIDLEITVSETGTGRVLLRLPAVLNAREDTYDFLQLPESSIDKIAELISGEEDIGLADILDEGVRGVRTFNVPQLRADATTRKVVWQAPWTHLVVADLHYLNYWESTERAVEEARNDLESEELERYCRVIQSGMADSRQQESNANARAIEEGYIESTAASRRGEFGQVFLRNRVDDLRFTTSKQAA